ncbi:hypothetical protein Y695_03499 [Hydrogenophaga sp. T4]|nr:hypothetical protein Y695_03499 [Hydrogenophaga sp. T4]
MADRALVSEVMSPAVTAATPVPVVNTVVPTSI